MSTEELTELSLAQNPVHGQMVSMGHEQVVFCQDNETGLKAIIAIHDTTLGPSLGGTRMWDYQNEMEALFDVLRLSRGMTYKAAISGLDLGGGKAVIIGDARTQKTPELMKKFGEFVGRLGGKYITAEDVGMSPKDMEYIKSKTDSVAGLPLEMGGSGDPSPVTAYGVYMGIKASAKQKWGNDNLAGKKVLVQGVGHVGAYLVKSLVEEGAEVMISDIYQDKIDAMVDEYKVTNIPPEDVYTTEMDIYSPCALGATVNTQTLETLTCSIIAGAANNQLEHEIIHGEMVREKGMLYAPDFLINAGGLINCHSEVRNYSRDEAMKKAENIYNTTLQIYSLSEEQNIPTYKAANQIAEEKIAAKKQQG